MAQEQEQYRSELIEIAGILAQAPDGPLRWKQYRLTAIADYLGSPRATPDVRNGLDGVTIEACAKLAESFSVPLEPGIYEAGYRAAAKEIATAIRALDVAGEGCCQDCGRSNPVWFAPNPVWNLAIGGTDATDDPGGFYCPICFIKRAEAAGIRPAAWELRPEGYEYAAATQAGIESGTEQGGADGLASDQTYTSNSAIGSAGQAAAKEGSQGITPPAAGEEWREIASALEPFAAIRTECALGIIASDTDQVACGHCDAPYAPCYRHRRARAALAKMPGAGA